MIATVLFARQRKIPVLALGDIIACVAPIGLFFGRIANFINGELFGRPSDVSWAVLFPRDPETPRHPSQLYEGLLEGVLLFLVIRYFTHVKLVLRRPGIAAGIFGIGMGFRASSLSFSACLTAISATSPLAG